uniref:Uncharacterized protein n=1 Tax=viral metagenome TaxID=1070528 RepID=A0A6C0BLC7_9ZZZZ
MSSAEFIASVFSRRFTPKVLIASAIIAPPLSIGISFSTGKLDGIEFSEIMKTSVLMYPFIVVPEISVPLVLLGYGTGYVMKKITRRN